MKIKGNGSIIRREEKPRNKCRKWELSVSTDKGKKTRQYKGTYTGARKALDDFKAELQGLTGDSQTFGDYAMKWHERREKSGMAYQTMRGEKSRLKRVQPFLGNIKLEDMTPDDIEKCLDALREDGLAESSLGNVYLTIHSLYRDAVMRGAVTSNPADRCKAPHGKSKEKRVISPSEMDALMGKLDCSNYYQRGVMLVCACGLRRAEAVGVRWGDLDDHLVNVRRADDGRKQMKAPKTKAGFRSVPVPDHAWNSLCEWRGNGHEHVVSPGYGMTVSADTFGEWWLAHKHEFGCDLKLHELRHSYLTRLAIAGVNPRIMQKLAGHSSLTVTLEIYTHVSQDMEREAVKSAFGITSGIREGN